MNYLDDKLNEMNLHNTFQTIWKRNGVLPVLILIPQKIWNRVSLERNALCDFFEE